jgi:ArsR family transcriptional regulator
VRKYVEIFKSLGAANRVRIVAALSSRPACVCELAHALSLNQPNLSRHLRVLENAGLVESRRAGGWTDYRLARHAGNKPLLALLRKLATTDPALKRDVKALRKTDRVQIHKSQRRS